jgi:glycosyltransferase involved in cell wall biosynthesis
VRLSFLLAKPTQFDAPFFRWMKTHRPDISFAVWYWQPVDTTSPTDSETGISLTWGINLLEGYHWRRADPANPEAFAQALRQMGVCYLVSNGWKNGFAPLLRAAQKSGIAMGLRIDTVDWDMPAVALLVRRLALGMAYKGFAHFFSSGSLCDRYLRRIGIGEQRIRRWPYLVDESFFARTPQRLQEAVLLRQRYGLDDRPVVLAICKWVERENPLELLKAFIRLNDPALQLVMVGDGLLRDAMEVLRQTAPQLSMIFPGYVPYTQLPAWYAMSSVFVHPASREVWGVSIHEALAAGCAAIGSSRVGSAYDLISPGGNGYTYPLGNVPALAQAIRQALAIPASTIAATNAAILPQWSYAVQAEIFARLTVGS